MASTLYFRSLSAPLWTGGTRADNRFSVKDSSRGVTPGATLFEGCGVDRVRGLLEAVGSGAGASANPSTVAGPTAGLLLDSETGPYGYFTAPLAADVTITGTISFDICAHESNMSANATVRVALYRVDAQGAFTLIIDSSFGTELGTSNARKSWTGAPTSTAMKTGDRILALVLFDDAAALTMGSGFTCSMTSNGDNASQADSSFTLTETLTFLTTAPTGSLYYLRDTASDIAGAKALSTVQGSGTVEAVHTTLTGSLTFPGDQWTASAGGADIEWFGPRWDAFTLSGVVAVTLTNNGAALENSATPFDSLVVELAICDGDGSNPVIWARSYTSQITATDPKVLYLSGAALSVGQGQRGRLRLYSADMRPQGNQVAGTDRTIRYDGTSTYASRLQFTQTITEAPGEAFVPVDPMGAAGFFGI